MSSCSFINLNVNSAEQFKESVSEPQPNTKIYLTFGKTDSWANDSAPDTANSSISSVYEHWSNMIGGKRLVGSDLMHVVPRFNWEANTNYIAYDHMNPNLYDGNNRFYVVTSEYNVYKCISNNNGALSTVEPTTINPYNVASTPDGYIWKYLYTISDSEQLRFTTENYIPVKVLTEDDASQQWIVQENAVDGGILHIEVTDGGEGYSNSDTIIVSSSGDGSGLLAMATINNISNTVNSVIVTDPGQNYTFAYITISDPGGGANAKARAIISPPGGHGSNPLYELGGRYVMINGKLKYDESGVLPTTNDFRQVGILIDPIDYSTSNVAVSPAILQATKMTTVGAGDYFEDEYVYQGSNLLTASFSGRVVSWNSETGEIILINTVGTPTAAQALIGSESFTSKTVSSVTPGQLEKHSGRLLYLNNFEPITRDPDQIEDFKILIKF